MLRMFVQAKFAKCMRDCKALDRRLTPTEVDITFARVRDHVCRFCACRMQPSTSQRHFVQVKDKGARKINFNQFLDALDQVSLFTLEA